MAFFGLFGKKNKTEDANSDASVSVKEKPKKAKNRKKNPLLKLFEESVWESVLEDFKLNSQFTFTDHQGRTKYLGLLFNVESIGGLTGKEAKKDESKGSIIEAIKTGRIKTYIRTEMLMDDIFVIIPDAETIENMDEFVMLTDIEYILCSVDDSGMVMTETENDSEDPDDPEISVTFDQIRNLIQSGGDVLTLLPSYSSSQGEVTQDDVEPDDDVFIEGDDEISDLPEDDTEYSPEEDLDDLPADIDGLDDLEDLEDDSQTSASNPDDDMIDSENLDVNTESTGMPGEEIEAPDLNDDTYDDGTDGGYDQFDDVNANDVKQFVTKKYYSGDLDLEISTEDFDNMFMNGNSYMPFQEDRGTGWLNEYLSNIAKDANTRMERLHNENLFRMRQRYMMLIESHCKTIAEKLDISNVETQYGLMRFTIEQNKKHNLEMMEQSVAMKKEQLEATWQDTLNRIGEEAATAAKTSYIERYGRRHDEDLMKIETLEKDEIERDYVNNLNMMNEDRRREAKNLLAIAIHETLSELYNNVYLNVLRDEKREYARLQNEMIRFIDDNRKDEKARIEALADQNKQTKKADEVRRDYTAKIKAMASEFEMKRTMLQADIDRLNHEHEAALESNKLEWANKLEEERNKNLMLQNQVDSLLEKYSALDDRKQEEYAGRINELERMNKSKDEDMSHIIKVHERSGMFTLALMGAIIVAAIGIGFMVGSFMNVRKSSEMERMSIYEQQYNSNLQSNTMDMNTGDVVK